MLTGMLFISGSAAAITLATQVPRTHSNENVEAHIFVQLSRAVLYRPFHTQNVREKRTLKRNAKKRSWVS